jgi:peptide/nickel transport system substrate-binding protein
LASKARTLAALGAAMTACATMLLGNVVSASNLRPVAAAAGGTIVYALPAQNNIPWYLPLTNEANNSTIIDQLTSLLYQRLIFIDNSYTIDYAQSIASRITYNAQGTVFHVYMNPQWRWSDGRPITSADAKFGWDVLLATEASKTAPWPSSSLGSGGLPQDAKSFVVNGPYEFTVTLKTPVNQEWFEYNGIASIPILPAHAWNRYPTSIHKEIAYLGREATNPTFDSVVSGPFELESAVENQAWTLVPNPRYAGHKASVSRLIFQYETSDAAEFAGLRSGQIQIGYLPPEEWAARAQLPDRLVAEPSFQFNFTWLNMNAGAPGGVNKIFDNLYVRQAFAYGMNNGGVADVIYHGQASPEAGPIPSVPRTAFLDPRLINPIYPYSPATGKKLLEAHGWREVDGVMTKGSEKMAFTVIFGSGMPAVTDTMELYQAGWAAEGIKVTLEPLPATTLLGEFTNPTKWQIVGSIGIDYGGAYPSGETLFYKGEGSDLNGWNDPTENKLVEATISPSTSAAANQRAFFAYEYYTAKVLPSLFMPNLWTDAEVATTVHGYDAATANAVGGYPLPQYWSVSPGS